MHSPLIFGAALTVLFTEWAAAAPAASNAVTAVRHWTLGDVTRVVIETTAEFEFVPDRVPDPDRVFFDLFSTRVRLGKKGVSAFAVNDPRLKQIRVAETTPGTARVVFDLEDGVDYSASVLSNPPRLIVELRHESSQAAKKTGAAPEPVLTPPDLTLPRSTPTMSRSAPAGTLPSITAPAPAVTSSDIHLPSRSQTQSVRNAAEAHAAARNAGESRAIAAATPPATRSKTPVATPRAAKLGTSQSMTRVLGLKIGRIVLDAGHGGHDTGTAGPRGLLEKDIVLDVCKRLGELIESRMGAQVVYTRSDDTFIPLERRTEIANESKADLFLSIHANSSPASTASGVETYYLNFTTSNEAMEVAARENASSQKTVYELTDLLQRIALQDKVEESRQFAARVQKAIYAASLKSNHRTRDRGVRKAPFVVLIGASMPSVLAEIGFISNPRDEALFRKPSFRQAIAEGLYDGIARYASTLSQFQVAQK